jgi:hypothetical protein
MAEENKEQLNKEVNKEGENKEDIYELKKNNDPKIKDKNIKDISTYITTKLYEIPYVNGKGYKIGKYHVVIDKKNLPFSSFDEIDHFLNNLFDYVKNAPNNNNPTADFNKQFFKNKKKKILLFTPVKYEEDYEDETKKTDGGKSRKNRAKSTKNGTKNGAKNGTKNGTKNGAKNGKKKNRSRKNR